MCSYQVGSKEAYSLCINLGLGVIDLISTIMHIISMFALFVIVVQTSTSESWKIMGNFESRVESIHMLLCLGKTPFVVQVLYSLQSFSSR